jgi:hypothetical protein
LAEKQKNKKVWASFSDDSIHRTSHLLIIWLFPSYNRTGIKIVMKKMASVLLVATPISSGADINNHGHKSLEASLNNLSQKGTPIVRRNGVDAGRIAEQRRRKDSEHNTLNPHTTSYESQAVIDVDMLKLPKGVEIPCSLAELTYNWNTFDWQEGEKAYLLDNGVQRYKGEIDNDPGEDVFSIRTSINPIGCGIHEWLNNKHLSIKGIFSSGDAIDFTTTTKPHNYLNFNFERQTIDLEMELSTEDIRVVQSFTYTGEPIQLLERQQ